MPVVCNDRCRVVQSAENCEDLAGFSALTRELGFLGPRTQVQGPGPCPQGHGPHNQVLDVGWHGQTTSSRHTVRTTTTTTTTAVSSQVLLSCSLQGDSRGHHGMPWRPRWARGRECPASQGATAPLVAATRADDRRSSSGRSSPPLFAEGGSCTVQRSTEPEDLQSKWRAPWRPEGARGAAGGSHGRLRGCQYSSPGGGVAGWRRRS